MATTPDRETRVAPNRSVQEQKSQLAALVGWRLLWPTKLPAEGLPPGFTGYSAAGAGVTASSATGTTAACSEAPVDSAASTRREFMAPLMFTLWLAFFGTLIGYLIYVVVTA